MKTIIAGSRDIENFQLLSAVIEYSGFKITEVVCGEARGVDRMGIRWGRKMGIPVKSFPANWDLYKMSAGYKRNVDMAVYADALILLWDGASKGSGHMLRIGKRYDLKIFVHIVRS